MPLYQLNLIPHINCIINIICTVLLIISFTVIKKYKNIVLHKVLNLITLILSVIFLSLYIIYHYNIPHTKYPNTNIIYYFYVIVLITHILCAMIILPLILLSFFYAFNNKVSTHKKISIWTLPIWLYVTISGIIVYMIISPYYSINIY